MNKKIINDSKFTDGEIELFERLKMCLMLNELYNKYKEKKFIYKDNTVDSYISNFQLKQISIAYIKVVIDTLRKFEDDCNYKKYILDLNKILKIQINKKSIASILKDFRDKTFHPQNKSFSNTRELYSIYFDDLDKRCEEIITILKKIFNYLISDKSKMVKATFDFYESSFYSKLKKVGEVND